jgi:hypothetical protein
LGLAKVHESGAENVSQSPTGAIVATHDGALLGPAAYMSPEPARGQAVDKRTDIVYLMVDPKSQGDLWVLLLFGDRKPFPFLQTEFVELQGQISPDGRWMAYTSDESGAPEVYVQSFPERGHGKWRISVNGGAQPQWRPDGKEVFYLARIEN